MRELKEIAKTFLAYGLMSIAVFLMIRLIWQYLSFESDVAFLNVKQDYLNNEVWLTSFYIHVFSTVLCLIAGLTQFSKYLQTRYRSIHRLIGKIYVVNILIINFPVALIMAVYANGGVISKTAFVTLDILWFWFTLKAWLAIKNKRIIEHKEFMIRSFALTLSAITLRSWKGVLTAFTNLDAEIIYQIDAWLGFLPNLLIAELVIYLNSKKLPIG